MIVYKSLVLSVFVLVDLGHRDVAAEYEPFLEDLWTIQNDVFNFIQNFENEFQVVQICLEWRLLLTFNIGRDFEVNLVEPVIADVDEEFGKPLCYDLFEELSFSLLDLEELLLSLERQIVD